MTAERVQRLIRLAMVVAYVLIFSASMFLNTKNNHRPAVFHADEPGKVQLILTGKNRFYHPLLMINTLRAYVGITGEGTPRGIVIQGRQVSALFMALAVMCLMGTAHLLHGRIAAVTVGVFVSLFWPVIEHAHHLKEDAALIFGLSVAALTFTYYWRQPSRWRLILLGAGCAMAAAGKYIGFLVLPSVLMSFVFVRQDGILDSRKRRLRLFFLGFFALFLLVNVHVFPQHKSLVRGVKHEASHVVTEHQGFQGRRFGPFYFSLMAKDIDHKVITIPAVVFYLFTLYRRRTDPGARVQHYLLSWPLLVFAVINLIPVQFDRYALPVSVWIMFMAGIGVKLLMETVTGIITRFLPWPAGSSWPRTALLSGTSALFIAGAIIPGRLVQNLDRLEVFAQDPRMELDTWVAENIPRDARILADSYACLQYDKSTDLEKEGPPVVHAAFLIGDIGSADAIRRAGYDYVVTDSKNYGRMFSSTLRVDPDGWYVPPRRVAALFNISPMSYEERYARARACYKEIADQFELVWPPPPGRKLEVNMKPGLRIYKVIPAGF